MKLSDYVIDCIKEQGVSHVFEFIGGAIVHLLDSISFRDDIECISVRHEQAGAFAAEAYARINGKLGVAMATSGPGALNLLTGIGSCYFDSVPCLFITGQVNTYEYKFDRSVRQIGFQETDIVSVAKPLTKYAVLVTEPDQIRYELEKSIYLAQSGRPGPVLLDIPMNLQRAQIEPETLVSFYDSEEYKELCKDSEVDDSIIADIINLLSKAKRPLILAGGGVRVSNSTELLSQFIEKTGIPIVSSLMGLDVVSHDNPLYSGLIGSYGNRYSNLILANCDLLLILGSRLDSRQTGTRPDTFARGAQKIHVDIDNNELNSKVEATLAVKASLTGFLTKMNSKLDGLAKPEITEWLESIGSLKALFPTYSFKPEADEIEPNRFMEYLSSKSGQFGTICLDVGQHQMWASQSFKLSKKQRLLNSGGMGAMGFALPAAIGASLASGDETLVIAGDGGIQLNIQEMDTLVRLNLPIKIVVINNSSLGMVRQFQDLYFEGRQQSTVNPNPSFIDIANAYKIPSFQMNSMKDVQQLDLFLNTEGPAFIEVRLEKKTEVQPKLVVNRPIEDMYPYLDREELKRIMLIDLVDEMDIPT
ncbi:thiamine pyrophosphate-binding protein [Paenibacillus monticola]|uniref:Thiamine pyrophosphate-binding protein n=1 Tax=Paenibacillus monticola TaxID=2666075 RepID=A0A7X2H6C0_9BACL|nr:thiamine pyrophosphate-binding protein [Paenibacillus monticola]MRN54376.1 thiamine pyrophosphate-binding protein [Paenibacillus monticola]